MDIKDMLLAGSTAEELIKDFKERVAAAQKEIEEEYIYEARANFVDAYIEYLLAIGLLQEDDLTDDYWDRIYQGFESLEGSFEELKDLDIF